MARSKVEKKRENKSFAKYVIVAITNEPDVYELLHDKLKQTSEIRRSSWTDDWLISWRSCLWARVQETEWKTALA